MPLYEFNCETCGEVFEVRATIQEKSDGLKPECPTCHGRKTRQRLTAGIVLHGNGGPLAGPTCSADAGPGCCRR